MAIKKDDTRVIEEWKVYAVTATASLFAYIWLVIILMAWTPNMVTVEEGIITFFFFPLLVAMAYAMDRELCSASSAKEEQQDELHPVRMLDAFAQLLI